MTREYECAVLREIDEPSKRSILCPGERAKRASKPRRRMQYRATTCGNISHRSSHAGSRRASSTYLASFCSPTGRVSSARRELCELCERVMTCGEKKSQRRGTARLVHKLDACSCSCSSSSFLLVRCTSPRYRRFILPLNELNKRSLCNFCNFSLGIMPKKKCCFHSSIYPCSIVLLVLRLSSCKHSYICFYDLAGNQLRNFCGITETIIFFITEWPTKL